MKRIIIIGSVLRSGLLAEGVAAFNNAEDLLKSRGFTVINPISEENVGTFAIPRRRSEPVIFTDSIMYHAFLRYIIDLIGISDAIYLLDNYFIEKNGNAWLSFADMLSLKIYRSDKFFQPYSDSVAEFTFTSSRTHMAHRLPERCKT